MPKRSSKRKRDVNQLAADIVAQSTGEADIGQFIVPFKNPAAVELGRLGGLKGGRARAEKLSKARRRKIAKDAAKKRWSNPR